MLAGGFDAIYRIGGGEQTVRPRGRLTRRDLLLQVAELDLHARALDRASRGRGRGLTRTTGRRRPPATVRADEAAGRNSTDPTTREQAPTLERHPLADAGVWARAAAQSRATAAPRPIESVQLTLSLGDEPGSGGEAGDRAAGDDHRRTHARRAGDPRPRRHPARRDALLRLPRRARHHPQQGPPHTAAAAPSCWSPA